MNTNLAARLLMLIFTVLFFSTRSLVAQTPPAITSQPANIYATTGGTTTLSVGVSGTGPFSYQWFFNGAPAGINGNITTVAGGGVGDGEPAIAAGMGPVAVAVDKAGNLFIADFYNDRLRKVRTNGIISTVVGNGIYGFSGDGGAATNAELANQIGYPWGGVAVDAAGNLFIVDFGNNRIRKVGTNGIITTVAANGTYGYSGDGGQATNAELSSPLGVAVDAAGNIFITDGSNSRIRKVGTNGIITTVAGNGTFGYSGDGGAATNAELAGPLGVAVDAAGNLFIADLNNNVIRKVDTNGIITTVAGNGFTDSNGYGGYAGDGGAAINAELNNPSAVAVDAAGNLFIADYLNNVIRKVGTNGIIDTFAGDGFTNSLGFDGQYGDGDGGYSGDGGAATSAELNGPQGVAVDATGNLFIADSSNARVRKVGTNGIISTVAGHGSYACSGDGGAANNGELSDPQGVAVDSAGNLFIADFNNYRVRKVDAKNILTTFAGNGTYGYAGDGGQAAKAELTGPLGVTVDAAGDVFIEDFSAPDRKVDTNGIITTVNASVFPGVVDAAGNVYFPNDFYGVSKEDTNGITTIVAGNGTYGFSGDGGLAINAELSNPSGVALDAAGNLFIADLSNGRVRKVDTNAIITTVAGDGTYGFSGDGGPATNAGLTAYGVAVDAAGNIFMADGFNNRIRKVTASNLSLANGGASLVLSNLSNNNAGNYYVIVTSPYGSVTSSSAGLQFQPWFTSITLGPGTVNLSFKGAASTSYVFSSTTNLIPPVIWTPLATNTTDANGDVMLIDSGRSILFNKFYWANLAH